MTRYLGSEHVWKSKQVEAYFDEDQMRSLQWQNIWAYRGGGSLSDWKL